jgi:ERCC4-type nuclease
MKNEYTILVDSRERHPLLIPENIVVLDPNHPPDKGVGRTVRLRTRVTKLPEADYVLEDFPNTVVIERKGSVREIAKNCLNPVDRARFIRELVRLREGYKTPYLLLEGTPQTYTAPTGWIEDPGIALDAMMRLLLEYRVQLLLLPASTIPCRRAAGEWAARLLLNGALINAPLDLRSPA